MVSLSRSLALLVLIGFSLAGCVAPRSFVDPGFQAVSYEDVVRRDPPLRLQLVTEFQRNGKHLPKADPILRDNAERILRASGVIVPVSGGEDGEISIVVNNLGSLAGAFGKGFSTGLTFGLAGNTVTDGYEMAVSITLDGRTIERTGVRHALHTLVGRGSPPDGLETMPLQAGFERVLEQMLLGVLHDMQHQGELGFIRLPEAVDAQRLASVFPPLRPVYCPSPDGLGAAALFAAGPLAWTLLDSGS